MFSVLRRRMSGLVVILLALLSGISCREHARHQQHLKDAPSDKKFNIITHSRKEDSMMVMMKGQDGAAGKNGSQGDPGLPGPPGPPGLAGLKGAQGVCTKEQCESNELKLLIQRVLVVEKYVKDQQNQAPPQPPASGAVPGQGQPAPAGSPQGPNTPPPQPSKPGQGQPAPAPSVPAGPPQGPNKPPPQPSKPAAPPVASPPSPGQGQPATAPAGSSQGPNTPPPQPPKPALVPVPAVPAGLPQVLWGTLTPSTASIPLSSPVGVTIQSTLEAPGTLLEGNGQIDIQGVVTPQVSVQRYNVMGNPATAPGMQPRTAFKKSRISSHRAVNKPKHAHKKSKHHSAARTHKL